MSSLYRNRHKKLQEHRKQWEEEWSEYFWNEIVLKNENKMDWSMVSVNPNITIDIVKENPNKPWNWTMLSHNQNITMDNVKENPDKPWDWYWLSSNPNITMDIVKQNPYKSWNWYGLSKNQFTKEKEMFMERKMREHNAAFKIQTYWRRANYAPYYKVCKTRLMRECEELVIIN